MCIGRAKWAPRYLWFVSILPRPKSDLRILATSKPATQMFRYCGQIRIINYEEKTRHSKDAIQSHVRACVFRWFGHVSFLPFLMAKEKKPSKTFATILCFPSFILLSCCFSTCSFVVVCSFLLSGHGVPAAAKPGAHVFLILHIRRCWLF